MNPEREEPLRDPRMTRGRYASGEDDEVEIIGIIRKSSATATGDGNSRGNQQVVRNLNMAGLNSNGFIQNPSNTSNIRDQLGDTHNNSSVNGMREFDTGNAFQLGQSKGGIRVNGGYLADRAGSDMSSKSSRYDPHRFRSIFDKFLSDKRGLVFRPLAPDELPILESRADEQQNEGCYGVAPTLDICLGMDITERQREFFKIAACGDIVLTKMCSRSRGNSGLNLQLLCFEGKKHAFLEDLDIVVSCQKWEMIPVDPLDLNKDYEVNDKIRCEILKLNTTTRELLLGMRGTYTTSYLNKAFPLGLVSEDELPEYYVLDRAVWQSKKKPNYNDIMTACSGFNNPNSIAFLGSLLGIYSNHNSLTLGLSHPFPKSTLASSLRHIHNSKLAQENLDQGLHFFRSDDTAKAFESFNKTIIVDPENIQALVYRAIIHAKEKRIAEAMRDLDLVLKRPLEGTSIKKDVAQCLISIGKMYQENSEEEKALEVYNDCLLVVPEHPETLKLLIGLHSQIAYCKFKGLLTSKIEDFKEHLGGMIEEEMNKERSGYYRKFVHSPHDVPECHPPQEYANEESSNDLVVCRRNSTEERHLSPLSQIREAAYREAKRRQDSGSEILSPRRRKKSKRKKSRRQSESSSASEYRGVSRRSSMADCVSIENQVDAFLAKCERDCGKVTAGVPLESVRVTIAQAVPPKVPEVRFIPDGPFAGNRRVQIASSLPTQEVNMKRSTVSLPEKINLLTDKYGNVDVSTTASQIIQTVTRTQVSTSKFEMTISSSNPVSTFVPIPTVFSSPSASSDENSYKPAPKIVSKWKPVVGQTGSGKIRTPEPEVTLKSNRPCNDDLERRIELVNLKVQSAQGVGNSGSGLYTRSRSRSSSISRSPFLVRSRTPVKSRPRSRSKSETRSNSVSLVSHSSLPGTVSSSRSSSSARSGGSFRHKSRLNHRSRSSKRKVFGRSHSNYFSSRRRTISRSLSRQSSRSLSRQKSISPHNRTSRSVSKESSLSPPRHRSRFSSRQRSSSRKRSRSSSRLRSRSRKRSRSISRERSRSISRERSRTVSRERSRSVSRDRTRSSSRERSSLILRERSRSRSCYRQYPYPSSSRGTGRISRNRSHLGSPHSVSHTRTPAPSYLEPSRKRVPRRGRYDPNYISPNYKGYNPIPAYKLDKIRTDTVQTQSSNSFNQDSATFCRTPGRVTRSVSSPRSPGPC